MKVEDIAYYFGDWGSDPEDKNIYELGMCIVPIPANNKFDFNKFTLKDHPVHAISILALASKLDTYLESIDYFESIYDSFKVLQKNWHLDIVWLKDGQPLFYWDNEGVLLRFLKPQGTKELDLVFTALGIFDATLSHMYWHDDLPRAQTYHSIGLALANEYKSRLKE